MYRWLIAPLVAAPIWLAAPPSDRGGPAAEALCPDFQRPTIPDEPTDPTVPADVDDMLAESQRLEPMLGVVLAYGQEHDDVFGGYGLAWHSDADASVYASVTTDVAVHRAALEAIVPFPDELIVCRAALAWTEVEAVEAQIHERYGNLLTHSGRATARSGSGSTRLRKRPRRSSSRSTASRS